LWRCAAFARRFWATVASCRPTHKRGLFIIYTGEIAGARRAAASGTPASIVLVAGRLERVLAEYAGKRIDVYAWDTHSLEVRILADSFNSIFLRAGLISVLWHVGAGVRMAGDDSTFGVARDAKPDEKEKLERIGWAIGGPVSDSSMKFLQSIGEFATTDPHVPNTMRGCSHEAIEDVAPIRLQIVQRVLVDSWSPGQHPLE